MKLIIKNICKISNAEVELNGITVIAGENNTGKSTVGKALYSIINSCCNYHDTIYDTRIRNINRSFNSIYRRVEIRRPHHNRNELFSAKEILDNADRYISNPDLLESEIKGHVKQLMPDENRVSDINAEKVVGLVIAALKVSDEDVLKRIISNHFNAEFFGQINNIFTNDIGLIELQTDAWKIAVAFENNEITQIMDICELNEEAVYIDNPFILGETDPTLFLTPSSELNHKENLRTKIHNNTENNDIINDSVTEKKLQNVYSIINRVCGGDVIKEQQNSVWGYKVANSEKVLDAKNLSTGLKTFAIIKTLLKNGTLQEKSVLILDEPEIHLHPQWQLLFAELIVLIQKEFNMHILLNTHSPYFMKAIEVYTSKYAVADRCKYYLACVENETSIIKDVTEHPENIYKLLARPLQDLENVRYEND